MKFLFAALAGCLVTVTGAAAAEPVRVWITDATLISPEKLDQVEVGSVLIENERIVRVERGAGSQSKAPSGATVVSGKGQYLIPGLIDSHVHLAGIPGMSFEQEVAAGKKEMIQEYLTQMPRSYLYFGYTTLIDLAVFDRKVLDDFRKAPLHPDLYDCGEPLVFANGYPMSFAPPETRFKLFPNFIYDAKQAASIPAEYKPEDHTPAVDVARVKRLGAVCIKTHFERGFGRDRNLPVMGADVLADVRKASTDAGLVLMMHANKYEAQKFAVAGNVDVVAHGLWNWGEFDSRTELPDEIKTLLDEIVRKKIGYQPTIQVMQGLRAYFDPEYLKQKEIPKVIPKSLLDWFNTAEGKWFKTEIDEDGAPDATMTAGFDRGPIRRVRQVVAYLAARNADILLATDTPSGPTYGNLPGLNGFREMQELEKAGLSLKQIFTAATLNNARRFKLDKEVGTIEPGKLANLVLLKKSPLQSIDAYDSISTVWVHGKAMARDELAADVTR